MNSHFTKTIAKIIIIIGVAAVIAFIVVSLKGDKVVQQPPVNQSIGNQSITINNLTMGQTIQLPYTVTGIVKKWFFEGSFPVFIKDVNSNQLGYGLASSTSDWMTADPIPFSVTLPAVNYQGPATLVFTKDNPSGEPQFDELYTVPVIIQ